MNLNGLTLRAMKHGLEIEQERSKSLIFKVNNNMENSAIYIDDTGSSQISKSKYDNGDLTSYLAVILTPKEKEEISESISYAKYLINKELNINIKEFHFVDIYSGKKDFKKLELDKRLGIFKVFIDLYKRYNCPILIQSLTDDDVIRNRLSEIRKHKKYGFDFSKNSHLCLWLLLLRIRHEEKFKDYLPNIEIFVDAGLRKPNSKQEISILNGFSKNSLITYKDSESDELMQFIDFIAFTLNRTRWILSNNSKKPLDRLILELSEIASFNVLNMRRELIDLESENTSEKYDTVLRETFDLNDNLTDEEVDKIKSENNK
jgi:hypothetical protein